MTSNQAAAVAAFGGFMGMGVGMVVGYYHRLAGRPWTGIAGGAAVGFGLGSACLLGGVAAAD